MRTTQANGRRIPRASKGKSLNKLLPDSRWKKIREQVYADYGQRCVICGTERKDRRLDCHKVWDYDDKTHVQRLRELVALCLLCHSVKGGLWISRWPGEPEGASLAKELKFKREHREEMTKRYREALNLPNAKQNTEELKALKKMANRESALEHFMEINQCDLTTGEHHLFEGLEEWIRRSQYEWQVDFGEFADLLEN